MKFEVSITYKKTELLKRNTVKTEVIGLYRVNLLLDRVFAKNPREVAWIKIKPMRQEKQEEERE